MEFIPFTDTITDTGTTYHICKYRRILLLWLLYCTICMTIFVYPGSELETRGSWACGCERVKRWKIDLIALENLPLLVGAIPHDLCFITLCPSHLSQETTSVYPGEQI